MPYSYSTTPLFVSEGDTLQFRYTAPSVWDYTETVTITIGGLTQYWYITTVPEDFQPDPFPLQSVSDAALDTMYVYGDGTRVGEQIITVSGLTPTTLAPLSLSANFIGTVDDYSVRINGGSWIIPTATTTVQNGDTVQVRMKSATTNATPRELTLGIGLGYEVWRITTIFVPRNEPVPFPDFTDLQNQPINKNIYSNIIRIQGLLNPATVTVDNGSVIGISNSNTTTTNADGFDVLSSPITGAAFTSGTATISNGQYLQLRVLSSNVQLTSKIVSVSVGDVSGGSSWVVSTKEAASTSPNSFSFPDVSGAIEDFLTASQPRPVGGITGLGTGISVPVTLVSTTSSEVKVKVNNQSVGVFPATVTNGDTITLYARSTATFGGNVTAVIKVGDLEIPTWTVITNTGPDTDASFTPPTNLNNRVPNTSISSGVVAITGINRPITISATNGALISIDYDTPVAGPRTFDPTINSSFYLVLQSSANLNTSVSTTVTVGTGVTNNPFTWTVTTYAVVPPPPQYVSTWYSKKNEKITRDGSGTITSVQQTKYDGYSIGTVVPILKQGVDNYGTLDGSLSSRFPGYLECNGATYNVADYPQLWEVIGNTYGGSGSYNTSTKAYSGTFKVPDYRNRRMCGTGIVDGNKGSSAFLPVSSGGTVNAVGQEGGFWYVDKVDASGPLPYEQVISATPGATEGTESPFFSLGIVRTTGAELVTSDVEFTMNTAGLISGIVGPVSDVLVTAPPHTHLYVSGVVEAEEGDPLIPWDVRALFGIAGEVGAPGQPGDGPYPDESEATNGPGFWRDWLTTNAVTLSPGPTFSQELVLSATPGAASLAQLTSQYTSAGNYTNEFGNFWVSPASGLVTSGLISTGATDLGTTGTGSRAVGAVIDTNKTTFRIDAFNSTSGSTVTHSHLITIDPVTNPQTDFSYGNESGAGSSRSGLGSAATSLTVQFNQSNVQLGLNTGFFTLNSATKKPIPNVALSPNRTVPLITPFHKVKYIIKAY